MKVLLIGPFPQPMNGNSFANEVLRKNLLERGISTDRIDTSSKTISGRQGSTFSIKKAVSFIHKYFLIYKVRSSSVVYLTTGHTFYGVCKYAPFVAACKFLKRPYVIHLHGNNLGREYQQLSGMKRSILRSVIAGASAGIVLSSSLRQNFNGLLPADKVFVVSNFVDKVLYAMPMKKDASQLKILYLSNLMKEKGILEVLDALLILQENGIAFQLVVAGSRETGMGKAFDQRIKLLGANAQYKGTITGNDKARELMNANVLVLPTYYKMEGQPICLLEGLATGNIVVTTAHSGIPDVVSSVNGFFVKPGSAQSIADCLGYVSAHLPLILCKMADANRAYAKANFTERRFTDEIICILRQSMLN